MSCLHKPTETAFGSVCFDEYCRLVDGSDNRGRPCITPVDLDLTLDDLINRFPSTESFLIHAFIYMVSRMFNVANSLHHTHLPTVICWQMVGFDYTLCAGNCTTFESHVNCRQ